MKISVKDLKKLFEAALKEIDVANVVSMKPTQGSTHAMHTGLIDGEHHYVKFSEEDLFYDVNPSLQPIVEYLAYNVYSLYPSVRIPGRVELVFDKKNERVGIATQAIKGKAALPSLPSNALGKKMSAGVYVDIFLANWDVVGTGTGNVIIDDDAKDVIRIDPGGSLTFRAQGGKKGEKFSTKAGELSTMLNPEFGAGSHFKFADLDVAAATFLSVPWSQVSQRLSDVNEYVTAELAKYDMNDLLNEWNAEFNEINSKLETRWSEVAAAAKQI
jgi:hypothetical protein